MILVIFSVLSSDTVVITAVNQPYCTTSSKYRTTEKLQQCKAVLQQCESCVKVQKPTLVLLFVERALPLRCISVGCRGTMLASACSINKNHIKSLNAVANEGFGSISVPVPVNLRAGLNILV
jgi:hypothetical protein